MASPAARADTPTLFPPVPSTARCGTSPTGTVCNFDGQVSAADMLFGVTCADGSEVLQTYTLDAHLTRFYGTDGVLQQTIRHYTYTGTLRDSAGGTPVSVTSAGAWLRVATATGQQIVAAGREIYDYTLGDFTFGAGPGMGVDWDPAVICPLVQ